MTVTIPKGSTGDRTYTAHYSAVSNYTVTFDSAGGTPVSPKTGLTEDSEVLAGVSATTKQGYTFDGWKYGNTIVDTKTTYGSIAANGEAGILSEIQLTAQWTENSNYTVIFNTAGESSIDSKTGVKWTDKVLENVTAPTREGYTFAGWKCGLEDVDVNTTYAELADSDLIPSIMLTAQWEIIPAPVGQMRISDTVWNNYRGEITSYNYYNDPQTVEISEQEGSGSVTIEYLLSDRVLALDELDRADFNPYPDG